MTQRASAPALLPELVAIVAGLPTPPTSFAELVATRGRLATLVRQRQATAAASPTIDIGERHVPGAPGAADVRVLVYRPRGTTVPCPALLWIHGGGYVAGTPEFDDAQVQRVVEAVGCVVVSVDYRLAPEHPHPAPLDDCHAALQWLHAEAETIHVDRHRLAIAGQSAGGGLCAALALLVRDRGEIRLCLQAPLQAMLDDRTGSGDGPRPAADGWVLTAESNRYKWHSLLGHAPGRDDTATYAVPARAGSLAGSAPAFLSIGALDLFTDENMAYAQRLMRDGVPTELHLWPGACHAFDLLAPQLAVSKASEQAFHDALRRAFGVAETVAAPVVASPDLAQRLRSNTPGIPDRDIARFAGSLGAPQPYAPGPEALPRAGVTPGELLQRRHESRGIYPGVARDYWVYVPKQLGADRDANLLVFQDGARYLGPECSAAVVLDTLIADGAIPPTVAVFVQPGDRGPGLPIYGGADNRSVEYDSTGDTYVRFLVDELLPEALHGLQVSARADRRAICGLSSGGHCALNAAWERPDVFGRVISHCGSFVDIRGGHTLASRIRRGGDARAEQLRVFLQTGEHDLDVVFGHWVQANRDVAAALAYRGIEHRLVIGRGGHSLAHGGAILPDTLRWLWRRAEPHEPPARAAGTGDTA